MTLVCTILIWGYLAFGVYLTRAAWFLDWDVSVDENVGKYTTDPLVRRDPKLRFLVKSIVFVGLLCQVISWPYQLLFSWTRKES